MDDSEDLLDLSFLTGDEQRVITQVLERDTQLREKDKQRVQKLRSSLSDPRILKRLSGDWFSDVRARRPWGQVGGVDIVRASIRRKKKTRGEWDQSWAQDDKELNGDYDSEDSEEEEAKTTLIRISSLPLQQESSDEGQEGNSTSKEEDNSDTPDIPMRRRIPSVGDLGMEEINLSSEAITGEENHTENDLTVSKSPVGESGHRNLNYSPSVPTLGNKSLSGSMMSLFSAGEIRSIDVQGWIQFTIQYDSSKKELRVLVIQCRDLTPAHSQTSNPYVKCYLLPDKSVQGKRKTKVKKKTLDPLFNETLKYKIERSELQSRFLNLSVWHRGSLARNIFLGEVELELATWDWSQTQPAWHTLQPRTPLSPEFLYSRGRLNLAAKFIPQGTDGFGLPPSGELHIWVKEAQQLVPHKAGNISSFVKCCVLPDDSPSSIQRTRVVPRSLRPMYNHTMVYDGFRMEDLTEACVEFTVWDQGTISNRPLGGIRLSTGRGSSYDVPVSWMDSTEQEKAFWETVIKNPGEWSEVTLPIRQNLTPR
ncbi:synaptotagmin-like protein 1 [Bufo gargarizans]|uniref:synaptotagmin-like protein 1 n=1 Tax=Bufo gargarizans TaxID=30331 RepID=UPI001CF56AAE|nr:synaptotagmin-like protein 1 [Bufo gargarizans]XP_044142015.1 synaptotagmin-like protein 1 [Bufo gargarizans]